MNSRRCFRATLLALLIGMGCGDLPPLPGAPSPDGGIKVTLDGASSESTPSDGAGRAPLDGATSDSVAGADARALDGGAPPRGDAAEIDAPKPLVCAPGYADCNGDVSDGCETAIDTPDHCGGCKTACGAVANGAPACVNGKCAVKCTAPYQDCDGKYENGCEIPVGRANACDDNGLAASTGATPPCGTPYCGSSSASGSVTNFGSWYCSYCAHCQVFSNGGSYCLYNTQGIGNFSGERCSSCCAGNDPQICNKQ